MYKNLMFCWILTRKIRINP